MTEQVKKGAARFRVYVIRLADSVWQVGKYRKANPQYLDHDLPHAYVGSTAEDPEKRLAKHKAGGRTASNVVKAHGLDLMPEVTADIPPMKFRDEAERREEELAQELRDRGWGVWCKAGPFGKGVPMKKRGGK